MAADVIEALKRIQTLPETSHWFCPREGIDDSRLFFPEDLEISPRDELPQESTADKVEEARARTALVLDSLQIFAFDGKDAMQYQQWLEERLGQQMRQCDVCIREYYRGRKAFKDRLNDTYDVDEVRAFMEMIDNLNIKRIKQGLSSATSQLENVPPEQRKPAVLSAEALYAIFETFSCRAMYADERKLEAFFDPPFDLVQTNKILRMSAVTPAMTQFLFGQQSHRIWWAERAWEKFKRNVTASEFEWSVREPLIAAMSRVQLYALEKDFLKQFWTGVRAIVQRLDQELITHALRAMDGGGIEVDVSRLALSHLQLDTDGMNSLLGTISHILKTSPNDFWEAMGTISPITWIEQFFCSPGLQRLIQEASSAKISDSPAFDDIFSWVLPFLSSIKPVNQAPACRSLMNGLMDTFQDEKYAQVVKTYCFKLGLRVLAETFRNLNNDRSSTSVGAATVEAFEVAEKYVGRVAPFAKKASTLVEPSSEVLRQIIGLDCKCIMTSYDLLRSGKSTPNTFISYHSSIWKYAIKSLDPGNVILGRRFLLAIKPLAGMEKFVARSSQTIPATHCQFNKMFDELSESVYSAVERIDDFNPMSMGQLFEDVDTATAVVVLLFSSDERVRDAGFELIKTMSGQSIRSEAVRYLLQEHFVDVVDALSASFRLITLRKAFTPASRMLKLCTDVIDVLCDPQKGFLRTQELSIQGGTAIEKFWQTLWQTLSMIFSTTEDWSMMGHDKGNLMDFCRDAMEFAEKFFDQFGVVSGALDEVKLPHKGPSIPAGQRLINQPKAVTGVIVKWLKLRDEILVSKSCALVCKLLKRLREFQTELSEQTLEYVMQIAYSQTKTTLRDQQKAELLRALEEHVGQLAEVPDSKGGIGSRDDKLLTMETIDLERWQSKAKASISNEGALANAISASSPAYERLKAMQAAKPSMKPLPRPATGPKVHDAAEFKRKRQKEMDEMEKKKAAAIAAQRKRLEGSGLQGLGVQGKDHFSAPKGSGMMVSSDDESEDDTETDMDKELFGTSSRAAKSVSNSKGLTDDQAKALRQQQRKPVKKQRLVRSARDMRARLAPDLSPLHKSLLSWDYFHEGGFPPNTSAEDYTGVINVFRDASDYQNTFKPLLVLEAWNGFLKAKEDNTARPYEIKVVNRSTVDAFLEVSSTMAHADAKELSEGDIILLSKSSDPSSNKLDAHCLSRVFRITRKKAQVEILYRVMPGSTLTPFLVPNATLFGLKIMSITPLEREYGALLGLQYYDLCDEITRAKPSPLLSYTDEKLNALVHNYSVNKAQAKAVKCAIDNDGFTLIQGPPGSGKTKTIVAIVGALLSDNPQSHGTLVAQPQASRPSGLAKKMLVCAPSNAAVDELVMRFKQGIKTISGEGRKLNIVRLGRSDAINANVHDVTLEELVNKKLNLNSATDTSNSRAETQRVMEEHKVVSENLRNARARMDEADTKGGPSKELKEEFDALRKQKAQLGQKVDTAKDNETAQVRQADINRRRAQQQVIDEAHVICATLSGSGHEMFQNMNVEFETVIIDEAAQCVELSALIPLKYGCAKCVLVGDPQQLPPTVFSKDAARFKYEQSLFVRMQVNYPKEVHLLDTQYRMHPEISLFPSRAFYESRLLDGKDMAALRSRPWHGTALLSPFRFFDVQGQHQSAPRGHSLINQAEINIAMLLFKRLTADFRNQDFKGKIGVITPYKSQLRELKEQFLRSFGSEIAAGIEFNTTDAFQGREAEIIIFSCVRASPAGGIGFLQDIRRMNVGLTRAKCSLWVLGNSQSLMKGEFWAKLVNDAKARDRYTNGDLVNLLQTPSRIVRRVDDGSELERTSKESKHHPQSVVKTDPTQSELKNGNGVKTEALKAWSNKPSPSAVTVSNGRIPANYKQRAELSAGIRSNISSDPLLKRKAVDPQESSRKRTVQASSSSSDQSWSDGGDVEMTDVKTNAVAERPKSTVSIHSAYHPPAGKASVQKPGGAVAVLPKSGGPSVASKVADQPPARKPPVPPPAAVLRQKKPVDPFIRKKPRT